MGWVVKYAGRSQTGSDEWAAWVDLVDTEGNETRYFCRFRTSDDERIDVTDTDFWGYVAYNAGKFIENRVADQSTREISSAAAIEAARDFGQARGQTPEPAVGAVRWTMNSGWEPH